VELEADHQYRRASENLREIRKGLRQAERGHKEAIRHGDEPAIDFCRRIHLLMVGLVAEASLRKIIADPAGFNEKERGLLLRESQAARWLRAVEFAFRHHYLIPLHLEINEGKVDPREVQRHGQIIEVLEGDLEPIITDRNKLAHAQWTWLLNFKETAISGPAPPTLNYRAIEHRGKAIGAIADLVTDLVVSEPTFKRDFEGHFEEVARQRALFAGPDYQALVHQLRSRRRGP
jgi:hypothetical protein